MKPINEWRPQKFSDIIGKANARTVQRLQALAKERKSFAAGLLGPFGTVKTSLARLLLKSYVCEAPDPVTADPCHQCKHCLQATPDHSGTCLNYEFHELNGNVAVERSKLSDLVASLGVGYWPPFLIVDEFQRLSERQTQEVFLDFLHDLKEGVFIATLMTNDDRGNGPTCSVLPEILDRLKLFHLQRPTSSEISAFLLERLDEWGITSSPHIVNNLVARSRASFRACLNTLDEARVSNSGILDDAFLDDLLPPAPETVLYHNPFND
jgi:replication-associated recombination protein RarA